MGTVREKAFHGVGPMIPGEVQNHSIQLGNGQGPGRPKKKAARRQPDTQMVTRTVAR